MSLPPSAVRLPLGLVVAGAVLVQAAWFALDGRLPRDAGRYWYAVPRLYGEMAEAARWPGVLVDAVAREGGWHDALVAGLMHVHRSPWTLDVVLLGWTAALLAGVAALSRRLDGDRAALVAVALAAGLPSLVQWERAVHVHVPETALVVGVAAVLASDPRWEKGRSVALAVVLGVLAVRLRTSAVLPLLALAPAVLVGGWRRGAVVLVAWGAAVVASAGDLAGTVATKDAHLAQDAPLAWTASQLGGTAGPVAGLLVAVGLALGLRIGVLVAGDASARALRLGLAGWVVAAVVAWARWRVGFGDVLPVAPALAVLAAPGLARVRVGPVLSLAPLALAALLLVPVRSAVVAWGVPPEPDASGLAVPDRSGATSSVLDRLTSVCADRSWLGCHVVAPMGLAAPMDEDPGFLGLFAAGRDDVDLRGLGDEPRGGFASWRVDAVVAWSCPALFPLLRERAPGVLAGTVALAGGLSLDAEDVPAGEGCTLVLLTRGTGARTPGWQAIADAALADAPARVPPYLVRGVPPAGWRPPGRPPR